MPLFEQIFRLICQQNMQFATNSLIVQPSLLHM